MWLADHVADERIGGELSDFVLDGRHRLGRHALRIAGEFLGPEGLDRRIFDVGDDLPAVILVGEHAHNPEKR